MEFLTKKALIDYHARTASNMEVFEMVAKRSLTPEEGAQILRRIDELANPWWLRWLRTHVRWL